jgi:microcystin-dependent protein
MDEELIGVIKLFSGNFIPQGYMECNGQLLLVQQNVVIFSILGTTYGGNGQTNFALPKLTPPNESMKYIICVQGLYPPRP